MRNQVGFRKVPDTHSPMFSVSSVGQGRTGGKGSVRRKRKTVHKNVTTDDKRLQSTLKRLGVNAIPAIEEVCGFNFVLRRRAF